jgi:G3E family GTPase
MGAKVHVVSGFLGSGKTTLIRHLMEGPLKDISIAIIENEFGEIGIDGEILKGSGTRVREINSGCICCSLSGDFRVALREIADQYSPDVIIIEPSGIARASDIVEVCRTSGSGIKQGGVITVIDTRKYFSQIRNFREFYRDQVISAGTILLTRTSEAGEIKTGMVEADIASINPAVKVIFSFEDGLLMRALDGFTVAQSVSHHDRSGTGKETGLESYCLETKARYGQDELLKRLEEIVKSDIYGKIVRVKGILMETDGSHLKADCIENEAMIEVVDYSGAGKICFIGESLKRDTILRFMEEGKA